MSRNIEIGDYVYIKKNNTVEFYQIDQISQDIIFVFSVDNELERFQFVWKNNKWIICMPDCSAKPNFEFNFIGKEQYNIMIKFLSLPLDLLRSIIFKIELKDLLNFCLINRKFHSLFCNNA